MSARFDFVREGGATNKTLIGEGAYLRTLPYVMRGPKVQE
jgi:hypothetical protein